MSFLHPSIDDLHGLSSNLQEQYLAAAPFPHIVIDNFFNPCMLQRVLEEFPDLKSIEAAHSYDKQTEVKFASSRGEFHQGPQTRDFLRYLNSSTFIDFLQALTSVKEPLIPDPHFVGGGLHEIKPGGFLKIHADFCRHGETSLDRRLNLLVYLNHDWQEDFGGHLELWDDSMTTSEQKILPLFNRMVVFSTTDYAYHGHPERLTCPADRSRKSLALYYYSNGRPEWEVRPSYHNQSTLFKRRPGEQFSLNDFTGKSKRLVKAITPPVLFDMVKRLKA